MDLISILASFRHNKTGAVLIAMQIALTLAIVSNALSVVTEQVRRSARPTGIDETEVISLMNSWSGHPQDLKSRLQADLTTLRALPEVVDAYATDGLPLWGGGYSTTISLNPDVRTGVTSALYFVDEHAPATLGIRLSAGRWFTSQEILDWDTHQSSPTDAQVAVVTRALAEKLFPGGEALGKMMYMARNPISIVGVVERMQAPTLSSGDATIENSVFTPYLWAETRSLYVIRARPGQAVAALQAAQRKLLEISRARIITRAQTFAETRARAYRPFRAMYLILVYVSTSLLVITSLGVIGLTSYWVGQRRRQIGIRRALGAQRAHILRYFHLENLLVVGAGTVAGIILAIAVNLTLAGQFETSRMSGTFILIGALVVLCLGQLSVFWPALRAAAIPPASAARPT